MAVISVIVPVYKAEAFINRCVDSILAQTFTDFELILVDDGSPDESGAICDEYAAKDERIHVIHQQNQGQAAARNHALDWVFSNSDSKYIGFVDSDDWVHPRYLELLREGIRRYDVNICQCGHIETDGSKALPPFSEVFSCITPEEQYVHHYSAFMWDKLFARSCWEKMRFPVGQIYEDLAIWYKILFRESRLALIDEALYYYFVNPNSTARKEWNPGRLARMDAWSAQVSFIDQGPFSEELLETALDHYCKNAWYEYWFIEDSSRLSVKEKRFYRADLSRRMRLLIKNYKRQIVKIGVFPQCFEVAHPFLYVLYSKAGLI